MEIIQTYMSDDTEVCAISDGSTIHLVDKNDLSVDDVAVGKKLRPSQMNEVYLEIPISELRELARRSEIYVEPDEEEASDEDDSEEDDSEEEEEAALPNWQALAINRFLDEYISLDQGMEVRVLAPVDVKINWESGDESTWGPTDGVSDIEDILENQETLKAQIEAFDQRIKNLNARLDDFVDEMNDAGCELVIDTVHDFLGARVEETVSARNEASREAAE